MLVLYLSVFLCMCARVLVCVRVLLYVCVCLCVHVWCMCVYRRQRPHHAAMMVCMFVHMYVHMYVRMYVWMIFCVFHCSIWTHMFVCIAYVYIFDDLNIAMQLCFAIVCAYALSVYVSQTFFFAMYSHFALDRAIYCVFNILSHTYAIVFSIYII